MLETFQTYWGRSFGLNAPCVVAAIKAIKLAGVAQLLARRLLSFQPLVVIGLLGIANVGYAYESYTFPVARSDSDEVYIFAEGKVELVGKQLDLLQPKPTGDYAADHVINQYIQHISEQKSAGSKFYAKFTTANIRYKVKVGNRYALAVDYMQSDGKGFHWREDFVCQQLDSQCTHVKLQEYNVIFQEFYYYLANALQAAQFNLKSSCCDPTGFYKFEPREVWAGAPADGELKIFVRLDRLNEKVCLNCDARKPAKHPQTTMLVDHLLELKDYAHDGGELEYIDVVKQKYEPKHKLIQSIKNIYWKSDKYLSGVTNLFPLKDYIQAYASWEDVYVIGYIEDRNYTFILASNLSAPKQFQIFPFENDPAIAGKGKIKLSLIKGSPTNVLWYPAIVQLLSQTINPDAL